jgi:hypothetical protein
MGKKIELGHSNVNHCDVVSGVLHGSCEECEFFILQDDKKTKENIQRKKQVKKGTGKKRRTSYTDSFRGCNRTGKMSTEEDYGYSNGSKSR